MGERGGMVRLLLNAFSRRLGRRAVTSYDGCEQGNRRGTLVNWVDERRAGTYVGGTGTSGARLEEEEDEMMVQKCFGLSSTSRSVSCRTH